MPTWHLYTRFWFFTFFFLQTHSQSLYKAKNLCTPCVCVCLFVAYNSNRSMANVEEKKNFEKLKFACAHTAEMANDESSIRRAVIIFLLFVFFCGDDHRKHLPTKQHTHRSLCALWYGNKISQCAEPLCNMSSWHHENAIPKRRT